MNKREHFQASSESESGWRQFSATDGQETARPRDGNSSWRPTDERVQVQGTDGRTDAPISGKFQSCFKMNFYFRPTKKISGNVSGTRMFKVSGYRDRDFVDLPEVDLPGSYKLLTAHLLVCSPTLCFFVDLSRSRWNECGSLERIRTDVRCKSLTFATIISTDLLQNRAHGEAL
jgi:hypothetical protein